MVDISKIQDKPRRVGTSRPKPQLSCQLCRSKKLKCDRKTPCSNCVKSSQAQCLYAQSDAHAIPGTAPKAPRRLGDRDRIALLEERLETLVATLQPSSGSFEPWKQTSSSPDPPVSVSGSDISLQHDLRQETKHFTSTDHWEGVLNSISDIQQDVRSALEALSVNEAHFARPEHNGPLLLFAQHQDVTSEELLSVGLPISTIHALLDLMINDHHSRWILLSVHVPSLREEIARYQQSPDAMDLAWLAELYGILSMASFLAHRSSLHLDNIPNPARTSHVFMKRAAQCLRNSGYMKPSNYTISAMILYISCEHNWTEQSYFDASVLLGLTIRLAMRLGYHRDPARFHGMTIFEGQMRRRTWLLLRHVDYMLARKAGLPLIIENDNTDTSVPMNLCDGDISPNMSALPLNRPERPSLIGFFAHQSRVLAISAKISKMSSSLEDNEYMRLVKFEQELNEVVNEMPAWLSTNSDPTQINSFPEQRNLQLDAQLILQSTFMSLHRKYLVSTRDLDQFTTSRETCLDAATKVLECQRLLSTTSGSDNVAANWRLLSLLEHEFLLAAMLICLDLDKSLRQLKQDASMSSGTISISPSEAQIDQLRRLKEVQQLWSRFGEIRQAGREAATILAKLIERFEQDLLILQDDKMAIRPTFSQGITNPVDHEQSAFPMIPAPHIEDAQDFSAMPGMDFDNAQIQSMLDGAQIDFDWTNGGFDLEQGSWDPALNDINFPFAVWP